MLNTTTLWPILVTVIVIFAFASILGGFGNSTAHRNYKYALPRNFASLIWLVALLFLGLGVYYASRQLDDETRGFILLLFGLQLLFFVAWTIVYHRFGDLTNALWAGIILFILVLASLWLVWQAGAGQASIYFIILLGWLGYELFVLWQSLGIKC